MKSEVEVPDGWTVKKLEDMLLFLRNGLNAKQKNHGKYMITRIETISEGTIDCSRVKYVDELSEDLVDKYRLIDGDILFSHINSAKHIGKTAIYNENNEIMIHGINLLLIRSNAKISSQFLSYLLKKTKRDHLFERIAKKAVNQASINTSQLKKIRFLVPPLPEQQKIADILSKVDEQIDLNEKIIEKTEELKKGLMQKLLTKGIGHTKFKKTELGEIPEEWDIVKLGDCVEQRKETILPSGEGKTTYVGLEHIDSGVSWLSRCETDFSVKSLKYKFSENNILYGKLRPYLDKAVLTTKEGICSTDIIVIQSKENSLNEFILPILHSKRFLDYANSTTKGSNLPRTSWKSISKFIIPFPSLDEQKQIASILSKVDEQIQDNKSELTHLKELKKGLMQDLLTGKVRVSV